MNGGPEEVCVVGAVKLCLGILMPADRREIQKITPGNEGCIACKREHEEGNLPGNVLVLLSYTNTWILSAGARYIFSVMCVLHWVCFLS